MLTPCPNLCVWGVSFDSLGIDRILTLLELRIAADMASLCPQRFMCKKPPVRHAKTVDLLGDEAEREVSRS